MTVHWLVALRVNESLYFVNARFLEYSIQSRLTDGCEVRDVVLMFSTVNEVDYLSLDRVEAINARLIDMGAGLHLSEVMGPVIERLLRSHLIDNLSGEIFLSQFDARQRLAIRPLPSAAG